MMHYQCKLHWGWGKEHSFSEETEFCIWDRNHLDDEVKKKLVKIARRYALDGDDPMQVWVSSVGIIPVEDTERVWASDMGWEEFLANEVEYTRELNKENLLYKNGNYNLELSPKNRVDHDSDSG